MGKIEAKLIFGALLGGTLLTLFVFWEWDFKMEKSRDAILPQRVIANLSIETSDLIRSENVTQKDKYLIYRCGGGITVCGGYADRIKGAMTAYMVANLTGRTFKMEMLLDSCDLHQFLVPNKVDWYLPKSFHPTIRSGHNGGNFSVLNLIDKDVNRKGEDKDYLALPGIESTYFYFITNRDNTLTFQASRRYHQRLSWMSNLTRSRLNEALYNHLFKPSQYLQNKLEALFKEHLQPRDNLVCAHLRFGRNPTIPGDALTKIKAEDLPNVWIFLNEVIKRKENVKIFIMTDNEEIVSESRKRYHDKIFFIPGPVLHVDRYSRSLKPETVCEGLEKVIFDQLVFMHCDVIIVGRSGLSQMAAYVRGKDDGVYCFGPSGKVLPCSRDEISMVFYGHN